jgi:hypothetical protein
MQAGYICSMRGTTALTSLFPSSIEAKSEQKGQRNVHIDRRDDALAARFYFYHHIIRKRYDDILLELEKEFFLTPNVIIQRLAQRTEYMRC